MYECDVRRWVESESEPRRRELRRAVHTILLAIGNSQHLRTTMLIKGGILLAIRYHGSRHTRDIDFSTHLQYKDIDEEQFLNEFKEALFFASTQLEYDLDCRLQSHGVQPSNHPDPSYPSLKMRIGYAPKQEPRRHKRLLAGNAADVIDVDYSFSEVTLEVESIVLSDGGELRAYSFADVVAEKYRAILQQEIRNRVRRQDAYDLYALLGQFTNVSEREKQKILKSLQNKSRSRNLSVDASSLTDPAIIERSSRDYDTLRSEVVGELPPFNVVYETVKEFYESLPW